MMLAKSVKHIIQCFHDLKVNESITDLEAMGISVNKESVAYME